MKERMHTGTPDAENGSFCRYSVSSSLKYARHSCVVLNES